MVAAGDIVVELSVKERAWNRGLEDAKRRLPSFEAAMSRTLKSIDGFGDAAGRSANAASKASAGGYTKMNRSILELSRGTEDFMSVYGTMGLTGAIRASSNNLSQFAMVLHPMAGAVAGFAIALGTALLPQLLKSGDSAAETAKKMDQLKESIKGAREEAARKFELEDIAAGGTESINKETKQLARGESEIEAAIAKIEKERAKLLEKEGELQQRYDAAKGRVVNKRVLPGKSEVPTGFSAFARDIAFQATYGLVDSTHNLALKESQGAAATDKKMQEEILKLDRERLAIVKEREELEAKLGAARIKEANDEHSRMRQRDIEQAREEEREMKQQQEEEEKEAERAAAREADRAKRLADKQAQFRDSLADDLDPSSGRERSILKTLRNRRRDIDEMFGGDPELTRQAEEAARRQLQQLHKPGRVGDQSPAALERGSSAAVGLLNRTRNKSVDTATKQLAEQKKTNAKIDQLIDSTRHPADLPSSGFN